MRLGDSGREGVRRDTEDEERVSEESDGEAQGKKEGVGGERLGDRA